LHALVAIHACRIIHKNLTADHIIIDKNHFSAVIIGCVASSPSHLTSECFEGDLNCVSPEQTSRINETIDLCSDVYSLGMIFHHMLSGELPFQCDNASELMKMHIFKEAQPLHNLDPTIPLPVSKFVAKLMSKKPEDRYQSAKGILYDLFLMQSEYVSDKHLSSVTLAEHDYSEKILLSQRIYGRSAEYASMISAFDRVTLGASETFLVTGVSGSGKTSLVLEMQEHITQANGFFISGKYDETRKDEPFSALLDAFNFFCRLIMMEDNETLSHYKKLIQEAVGNDGKVLTNLIKNLSLIIGDQEIVADTIGKKAKNQLYFLFLKLVRAICFKEHPLVIFFDDLQRADPDSLQLVLELMMDKSIKYLLIVGAYRYEESDRRFEKAEERECHNKPHKTEQSKC